MLRMSVLNILNGMIMHGDTSVSYCLCIVVLSKTSQVLVAIPAWFFTSNSLSLVSYGAHSFITEFFLQAMS